MERPAVQAQRRALAALGRLHGRATAAKTPRRPSPSGAAHGQNTWRFWGQQFGGLDKQKALDLMDARGIIVRRSGIFDGEGANYLHQLANGRELFDNWIEQLKAWVKEERNHPSILIWSIENEVTFINSRNLGLHAVRGAADRPGRPRGDGPGPHAAGDGRRRQLPGGRVAAGQRRALSGELLARLSRRGLHPGQGLRRPREAGHCPGARCSGGWCPTGRSSWANRTIVRGSNPAAFSQFGGEGCFTGWGAATQQGAGLLAKMLAEGYRWHGVAAHHFWLGAEDATLHYNSWKPVCVLCRQWNWTFGGGSTSRADPQGLQRHPL